MAPRLEIIPLTSAQGISEFIRQFEILSNVTYVFDDRNDESENDAFFDAVQRQKDSVKSMRTQVVHANPEGLDKETVIEEVQAATSQGTQKVKLSGKDSEGNRRTGDNNSFQLKQKLKFLSITPEKMAKVLVDKFLELVDQGIVSVGRPTQKTLQKLSQYQGG